MKKATGLRTTLLLLFSLVFLCIFPVAGLFAAGDDAGDPKPRSTVIFPVFYYTPETRFGTGLTVHYTYRHTYRRTGGRIDRPNTLSAFLFLTQNRQVQTQLSAFNSWKNDRFRTEFDGVFSRYPDKFYGIGNDTSLSSEETYTHSYGYFRGSFLLKATQNLYAGPDYILEISQNEDFEEGGLLASGDIRGSEGTLDSGLGITVHHDTRDNGYFPTRGSVHLFSAHFFGGIIGSTYTFSGYRFDSRRYIPLFDTHVLALQAYMNIMTGDVPFHMLSLFGGNERMRGYFLGRYRDKAMLELQAEYRLPVFRRLGIAVFGGAGDVAPRIGELNPGDFKISAGAGIRFTLDPRERINLRVDGAFGKDERGVYVSLFEAF